MKSRVLLPLLLAAVVLSSCVLKITPRVSLPTFSPSLGVAEAPSTCKEPPCYCMVEEQRYRYKTWSCTGSAASVCGEFAGAAACFFNSSEGDWCEYVGGGSGGQGNYLCFQWNGCYDPGGYYVHVKCNCWFQDDIEVDFLGTKKPEDFKCGCFICPGCPSTKLKCCDPECATLNLTYAKLADGSDDTARPTGIQRDAATNAPLITRRKCGEVRPSIPGLGSGPAMETAFAPGPAGCRVNCTYGDTANYYCYKKTANEFSIHRNCKTAWLSTLQGGRLLTVIPCDAQEMARIVNSPTKKLVLFKIGQGQSLQDFEFAKQQCRLVPPDVHRVTMGKLTFEPTEASVPSYVRFCFENKDIKPHSVCQSQAGACMPNGLAFDIKPEASACIESDGLERLGEGSHTFMDGFSKEEFVLTIKKAEAVFALRDAISPPYLVGFENVGVRFESYADIDREIRPIGFFDSMPPFSVPARGQTTMQFRPGVWMLNDTATGTLATLFVLSETRDVRIGDDMGPERIAILSGSEVCFNNTRGEPVELEIYERYVGGFSYIMNKSVVPGGKCCWTPEPGKYFVNASGVGGNTTIFVGEEAGAVFVRINNPEYSPPELLTKVGMRVCFVNPSTKERTVSGGGASLAIPAKSFDCSCVRVPCLVVESEGTNTYEDSVTKAVFKVSATRKENKFMNITAYGIFPQGVLFDGPGSVCFANKDNVEHEVKLAEKYLHVGGAVRRLAGTESVRVAAGDIGCIELPDANGSFVFTTSGRAGELVGVAVRNDAPPKADLADPVARKAAEGVARIYFTRAGPFPRVQRVGSFGDIELWNADNKPHTVTVNTQTPCDQPDASGVTHRLCPTVSLKTCDGGGCGGVIWQSRMKFKPTDPPAIEIPPKTYTFTDAGNKASVEVISKGFEVELEAMGIPTPSIASPQTMGGNLNLINLFRSGPMPKTTLMALRGYIHQNIIPVITTSFGGPGQRVVEEIVKTESVETLESTAGSNLIIYNGDRVAHKVAFGALLYDYPALLDWFGDKELPPCGNCDVTDPTSDCAKRCAIYFNESGTWWASDDETAGKVENDPPAVRPMPAGIFVVIDIGYGQNIEEYNEYVACGEDAGCRVSKGIALFWRVLYGEPIPAKVYGIFVASGEKELEVSLDRTKETGWGCAGYCQFDERCLDTNSEYYKLFKDFCDAPAEIKDQGGNIIWSGSKRDCYNRCKNSISSSAVDLRLKNSESDNSARVCFRNDGWKTRHLRVLDWLVAKDDGGSVSLPYHGTNQHPINESYTVFKESGGTYSKAFDIILATDIPEPEVIIGDEREFATRNYADSLRFVSPTQIKFSIKTSDKRELFYREKADGEWKPFLLVNGVDDGRGWKAIASNGQTLYFPTDFSGFGQDWHGQIDILDNGTILPGCTLIPMPFGCAGPGIVVDASYDASDDSFSGFSGCDVSRYEKTVKGDVVYDSTNMYQKCLSDARAECDAQAKKYADEMCRQDPATTPCKNNGPCQANPDPNVGGDCCADSDCSCPRSCEQGAGCEPDYSCIDECNVKWQNYIACISPSGDYYSSNYGACYAEKSAECEANWRKDVTLTYKNVTCSGLATTDVPYEHIIYTPPNRVVWWYKLENGRLEELFNFGLSDSFVNGVNSYFYVVSNDSMLVGSSDESIIPVPKNNKITFQYVFTYRYQLTKGSNKIIRLEYGLPVDVKNARLNVMLPVDSPVFSWKGDAMINQTYDDDKIRNIPPGEMGCFEAPFPSWPTNKGYDQLDGYVIYDADELEDYTRLKNKNFYKEVGQSWSNDNDRLFNHVWAYQFFGSSAVPNNLYPEATRFVELADFDWGTRLGAVATSPGGSVTLKNKAESDAVGITNHITYEVSNGLYQHVCPGYKCPDGVDGKIVPPIKPDKPSERYSEDDCKGENPRAGCRYFFRVDGGGALTLAGLEPGSYKITESVSDKSIVINSKRTDIVLPLIYESWDPTFSTVMSGSEICVRNTDEKPRTVTLKGGCGWVEKCIICIGQMCFGCYNSWECSSNMGSKEMRNGELWCPVASANQNYAFVDELTGAILPVEVKSACDGSELEPIAKRLVSYDPPESVWRLPEFDRYSDYNPHGPAVPSIVTAPVGLPNEGWAKDCIANALRNIKEKCPNCTSVLPVPNDIPLDEQKAFINFYRNDADRWKYVDLVGQFAFLGERGVCNATQLMRDKINISQYAVWSPPGTQGARSRLSILLGYGIPDASVSAWGGSGCFSGMGQSEARKEAALAFKEVFEVLLPEMIGSGMVGMSMHCLTDGSCLPWAQSGGKALPLGLYDSSGEKDPAAQMWWKKCGSYFYAGEGLLPVLGAAEETNASTCDPSRLWAAYQQYKCGVV
ncbi:MAG: hypothetical protein QXG98_01840 [Candidatus Micrarchaeia archaeon]